MTKEVVCQSKQLSLCHYMCTVCHPLLSDLFARETLDTCATSLAGVSKDLAHVLKISPVNGRIRRLIRETNSVQVEEVTSECDH